MAMALSASSSSSSSTSASSSTSSSSDSSTGSPPMKVIALVDMDCFECQVWQRMFPQHQYWGKPCIVADTGGRIVSVTYEARELGISRDIRVREALKLASRAKVHLLVFTKPNDREKPDGKSTRYASWEIVDAIKEYVAKYSDGVIVEYASSDEFFLDITTEVELRVSAPDVFEVNVDSHTFLEGEHETFDGDKLMKRARKEYRYTFGEQKVVAEMKLVYGGVFIQEILSYIFKKTKFKGSAGIGTNKLMAKLAVSLHKPNGITILPDASFPRISKDLLIEKIVGLGGKFGEKIKEKYQITTVKQLMDIELEDLEEKFPQEKDRAMEAYLKCRGISDDPVKEKLHNFEVSCAKTYYGQITSDETLMYHLHCLAAEMMDRLGEERERHRRRPNNIRASVVYTKKKEKEAETLTWSFIIDKPCQKDANSITKETLDKIFKDVKDPISSLRITKICLHARGFSRLKTQNENHQLSINSGARPG